MKSIYLYNTGVKPWEQTKSVSDHSFATLTIIQRSIPELVNLWQMLVKTRMLTLPIVIKWHTIGRPLDSKIQEYKLLKKLKASLGENIYIEKNSTTGIYSFVNSESISSFDLNSISNARYSALLFASKEYTSLKNIWECFKAADESLEAEDMMRIIRALNGSILCRVVESDTHAVIQFVGMVDQVDGILISLSQLGVERISEGEASTFINCE